MVGPVAYDRRLSRYLPLWLRQAHHRRAVTAHLAPGPLEIRARAGSDPDGAAPDRRRANLRGADLGGDLLAHSSDPLIVAEPDGGIVLANAAAHALARSLGLRPQEFTNVAETLGNIRLVNGGGSPIWIPTSSGDDLEAIMAGIGETDRGPFYRLHSTRRLGANGDIVGWILQLTNITNQISVARGKSSATMHRDRMLNLLSHDMRSPHVAILSALAHPDLRTVAENPRQVIERAARRALNMVDSVVRMVRAESCDYALEPIELAHVLEEVVDLVWSAAKEAQSTVELKTTTSAFVVMSDRTMILQALTALLANVINYNVRGQTILVELRTGPLVPAATVECTVSYSLKTLSQRELSRMFTRFAPLQPSATGSMGENDGLSFVRAVILRHGGTLEWETMSDARRRISIRLPLADPESAEAHSTATFQ